MSDRAHIEAAIAVLQGQRALLGDAVVEAALQPLREQLLRLQAPQQLRQVSVLFLDVAGSTALSQQLDPEDVHALMDGLLARCTQVVAAHEGRVLQYAGDSLLAVFGAGRSREDDAERAVHCGLGLLEQGRAFAAEVLQRHQLAGCDVRVGVHTGPVLLGGGVDDEGTVRGHTVNIAARMEQSAPPGALRISHDTALAVRGVFDVQAQPPLQVKGHDGALRTFLVVRAKPRAFRIAARGIEGVATPLLGRDAELAQLVALPAAVARSGQLHAATLLGEPGIGKSRLLAELQAALEAAAQPVRLLRAQAHAQGRLQPYALLRELLFWRLQVSDSDSPQQARDKLERGLCEALAQAQAHRVGQLIGLDFSASAHVRGLEPALLRRLGFEALAAWLAAQARDGALPALLLEDLHWADAGSLEFLDHLAAQGATLPLLLVASARPALLEAQPSWADHWPRHLRLELQALGATQRDALAHALLARVQGDAGALHALLLERCDGNPFFMEELVRMFLDSGVIERLAPDGDSGVERWHVRPERLQAARVPGTLVGVLQARLDALPDAQRQALQRASIVGAVFWDDALAALDAQAPAQLPALQQRSLVEPAAESRFEHTREERFRHHLLQQVTYDTVLRAERRACHAAAAQWLAERTAGRSAEYLAITAEHFHRAGDDARALDYFERAIEDAVRRYANAAAVDYLQRALASPALTDVRRRAALLEHRQKVADVTGDRALQQQALDEEAAIAEALDDDAMRARVLSAQGLLASRRNDETTALALAQRALPLADRSGDVGTACLLRGQIAFALMMRNELTEARDHVDTALADARRALQQGCPNPTRLQMMEVQLMCVAIDVARESGDFATALRWTEQALELAAQRNLPRTRAYLLRDLGVLWQALGRYEQALSTLRDAMAASDDIGMTQGSALCEYNMAVALYCLDDLAAAERRVAVAEANLLRTEAHSLHIRTVLLQGDLAQRQGRADAAQACYRQALALAQTHADAAHVLQAHGRLAAWHLAAGDLAAACAAAETVVQGLPADMSALQTEFEYLPALTCYRVWHAAGDARAAAHLQALRAALHAMLARTEDTALQQDMLQRVPVLREIEAAWQAQAA